MGFIDGMTRKFAEKWVDSNTRDKVSQKTPIVLDIEKEIAMLSSIKDELVLKDDEIRRGYEEWDRTFNAICDNIIIINKDHTVSRANTAFMKLAESLGVKWNCMVGRDWTDVKMQLGFNDAICVVDRCFTEKKPVHAVIDVVNKIFHVSASPLKDECGDVISVVRVSRDITKAEIDRRALIRRNEIFKAISDMSKVLVDHDNWQDAMKEILGLLGGAVGAERAYIFENRQKSSRFCSEIVDAWLSDDTGMMCPPGTIVDCINYDSIPELEAKLKIGESVQMPLPKCRICKEKDHCLFSGEVNVFAVPVFVKERWWGFIGFDYYKKNDRFKEDDVHVLRVAADIIGGVIYHRDRYYTAIHLIEGREIG